MKKSFPMEYQDMNKKLKEYHAYGVVRMRQKSILEKLWRRYRGRQG